jgi:alkaline phosphatase
VSTTSPRRAGGLALLIATMAVFSGPVLGDDDRLKALQSANVASAKQKIARPYHFGSQETPGVFSNHTSHSNRLIPFYTFGRKLDPVAYLGENSAYRHPESIHNLYGFLPKNTLNPTADYCDQSDAARIMADAVKRGVKHLFIVWFDGLDWPTTQAAAIARTGKIYTEGKGSGLIFQDYTAEGSAHFGYYVTAPTADLNVPDVDAQTVTIPSATHRGGYDAEIAGATPWAVGPLGRRAPGYLKGQSGHEADKSGVAAIGRELHAYTDSAPSAAEFVSGKKAYNNSINVLDNGKFTPTLFHRLQNAGWKVGTVTSVPFNHASPSAMYAHNVDRDDYQDLARDMLGLSSITQQAGKEPTHPGLDVVMGTGFGQIASEKGLLTQGMNGVQGGLYITDADKAAIDVARGGNYVVAQTTPGTSGAKLLADAAARARSSNKRLFALFGTKTLNHLPYRTADGRFDPSPDLDGKAESYTEADLTEQPTLADMTRAALTVVAPTPDQRFALFIEAGDVDFALHKNNLDNAVGALYSGEDAIKAVISWVETQSNWDDSALIVAADHGHYLVIDDLKAIAGGK